MTKRQLFKLLKLYKSLPIIVFSPYRNSPHHSADLQPHNTVKLVCHHKFDLDSMPPRLGVSFIVDVRDVLSAFKNGAYQIDYGVIVAREMKDIIQSV